MFWFARPPYVRWAAATLVVLGAAALEFSDRATTPHPFAAQPISAGSTIDESKIEWRDVPTGLLPEPDLSLRIAARQLVAGEPIVPGAVSDRSPIPAGWWSVPVPLPENAAIGTSVRIVVTEPRLTVDGIVVAPGESSGFDVEDIGLVAVPGESSSDVAVAAASGDLVVLLEP